MSERWLCHAPHRARDENSEYYVCMKGATGNVIRLTNNSSCPV